MIDVDVLAAFLLGVILVVDAGILYLFWRAQRKFEPTQYVQNVYAPESLDVEAFYRGTKKLLKFNFVREHPSPASERLKNLEEAALELVERRIKDGTASPEEVVHFLKLKDNE